jgi:5-methyltetrahydrofolate--homocysteine methyltransferase
LQSTKIAAIRATAADAQSRRRFVTYMPSGEHRAMACDPDLRRLHDAVLTGDLKAAVEVTRDALNAGIDPQQLVTNEMIPAMDEVGRRFESNEYFVPELLISARAMKGALELIRPLLAERGVQPVGRVVIGTVKGDLHDIGKGLVAAMLEGGGFDVVDLGVDVLAEKFVAQARASHADIIAVSALLTTTMTGMKSVIHAVQQSGLKPRCKVIVGGAPVTQQFADSIGADGYSSSAAGAVALVRKLLSHE